MKDHGRQQHTWGFGTPRPPRPLDDAPKTSSISAQGPSRIRQDGRLRLSSSPRPWVYACSPTLVGVLGEKTRHVTEVLSLETWYWYSWVELGSSLGVTVTRHGLVTLVGVWIERPPVSRRVARRPSSHLLHCTRRSRPHRRLF